MCLSPSLLLEFILLQKWDSTVGIQDTVLCHVSSITEECGGCGMEKWSEEERLQSGVEGQGLCVCMYVCVWVCVCGCVCVCVCLFSPT